MSTRPRRVDPLRRQSRLDHTRWHQLHTAWTETRAELDRIDALLTRLAARRHHLAARLAAHRDQLWPRDRNRYGRRPGTDGTVQLPTLPATTTKLWGRRLRAVCLALLRLTGESTLTELHVLLHRRGYELDSTHPVKALADALRYETLQGRARRTARGIYAANPGLGTLPTLNDLTHLTDAA